MRETVLVFCAHPDDTIIGLGGTIAKFIKDGKNVVDVIFSYGQLSHPYYKEEVIIKKRVRETRKVDQFLGAESIFLGLADKNIAKGIEEFDVAEKIKKLVEEYKPTRIFTLSRLDPHPDHRAVSSIVLKTMDEIKYRGNLYTFEVWNVVDENSPRVYFDITDTFRTKIEALKHYKTQVVFIYALLIPIFLRAILHGRKNKCRYAERVYKIK